MGGRGGGGKKTRPHPQSLYIVCHWPKNNNKNKTNKQTNKQTNKRGTFVFSSIFFFFLHRMRMTLMSMFYCFVFLIIYPLESPPPPPLIPPVSLCVIRPYRLQNNNNRWQNDFYFFYFLLTASSVLFSQDVNMFLVTSHWNAGKSAGKQRRWLWQLVSSINQRYFQQQFLFCLFPFFSSLPPPPPPFLFLFFIFFIFLRSFLF